EPRARDDPYPAHDGRDLPRVLAPRLRAYAAPPDDHRNGRRSTVVYYRGRASNLDRRRGASVDPMADSALYCAYCRRDPNLHDGPRVRIQPGAARDEGHHYEPVELNHDSREPRRCARLGAQCLQRAGAVLLLFRARFPGGDRARPYREALQGGGLL